MCHASHLENVYVFLVKSILFARIFGTLTIRPNKRAKIYNEYHMRCANERPSASQPIICGGETLCWAHIHQVPSMLSSRKVVAKNIVSGERRASNECVAGHITDKPLMGKQTYRWKTNPSSGWVFAIARICEWSSEWMWSSIDIASFVGGRRLKLGK